MIDLEPRVIDMPSLNLGRLNHLAIPRGSIL